MIIVTVKFAPSDKTQDFLWKQLLVAAVSCEFDGIISNTAEVETVFSDDEITINPQFKGIFLVKFESVVPEKVLERLKALPGVDKAYFTPFRGWP